MASVHKTSDTHWVVHIASVSASDLVVEVHLPAEEAEAIKNGTSERDIGTAVLTALMNVAIPSGEDDPVALRRKLQREGGRSIR